jgi:hypothetical protein
MLELVNLKTICWMKRLMRQKQQKLWKNWIESSSSKSILQMGSQVLELPVAINLQPKTSINLQLRVPTCQNLQGMLKSWLWGHQRNTNINLTREPYSMMYHCQMMNWHQPLSKCSWPKRMSMKRELVVVKWLSRLMTTLAKINTTTMTNILNSRCLLSTTLMRSVCNCPIIGKLLN